jgi:hypothetical protein
MKTCNVDRHPNRVEIDEQLVAGVGYRVLISRYGFSLGALSRHKNKCLKSQLAEAMRERSDQRAETGSSLLSRVEEIVAEARDIMSEAKRDKKYAAASNALNAATRALTLIAHLSGELANPSTGGIHFHQTRNVTTVINVNDDLEIAQLFGEATRGYDPVEIERLKLLAESDSKHRPSGMAPEGQHGATRMNIDDL